ncbi:hypothetical protein [Dactylosporangium sp. CA-139066]|uniref:hypothetical protein n=1 Tax=Dactylosporangium sp. CA-139066 TaxID=3239930 RepID=UPI003D8E25E2
MQRLVLLGAAATLALALAGCGGGAPAAAPSGGADHGMLVEAAQCMRDHGFADFPDPVQAEGRWVIPPPASDLTPPPECLDKFRGAKGTDPRRPLSADQIAQRRTWAECIRGHGIPDVPDPDGEGNFVLPTGAAPLTGRPQWNEAREACRSLEWPGVNFDK